MGAGCVVWRKAVFEAGYRFQPFFWGHGVLEDVHLALRVRKNWKLLESGDARCVHLHSKYGRESPRITSAKTAINYRFVFIDIVPSRSYKQELRFWYVQILQLMIFLAAALRRPQKNEWLWVIGKVQGIFKAIKLKNKKTPTMKFLK
jgi:hypothetical protein